MSSKNNSEQMKPAFEDARRQALNVDWFTWQIAWHAAQPPATVAEPGEFDPIELAQELYRAHVHKVLADVEAIARDRTDAHWAGFQNAIEEVRTRLEVPAEPTAADHPADGSKMIALPNSSDEPHLRAIMVCNEWRSAMTGLCTIWPKTPDEARDHLRNRLHPTAQQQADPEEDEQRDQFESVVQGWNLPMDRQGHGYVDGRIQDAWWVWRAAQSGQQTGVAEDVRDAARYRWLRDTGDLSVRDVFGSWNPHLNDGLDVAVDAAIAAATTQQGATS